jgi:hypothetical protein
MTLTEAFLDLCERCAPAFAQQRTARRATRLMFSGLLCAGRKWITRLLCVMGREWRDWSADYKLFSRSKWDAQELFVPAVEESLKHFGDGPIRLAGDETRTRRGGRRVKRSRWTRDPMSPPFRVNFMKGIRWVQFSALLPLHQTHDVSARSVPVSFEPVDLPAKPGRRASPEQRAAYEAAKKRNNMCLKAIEQLRRLRGLYDRAGAAARLMLVGLDGGFCNKTMFTAELDRIALIARARKDAALCHPANDPARPRKVYADEKFTPEQVRDDDTVPWQTEKLYIGGRRHKVRYKEIGNVLWPGGAKRRPLRLFVIAPTPYRLSPGMPTYYRQPGYLLVTECDLGAHTILQCYFDRWQIEVNHRDEKQHIGINHAQVWNDKSVDRLPALMVAAYSFLLLASLNAFGPLRTEDFLQPPLWQKRPRKRASCLDLIAKLREESAVRPETPLGLDFEVDLQHVLIRAA